MSVLPLNYTNIGCQEAMPTSYKISTNKCLDLGSSAENNFIPDGLAHSVPLVGALNLGRCLTRSAPACLYSGASLDSSEYCLYLLRSHIPRSSLLELMPSHAVSVPLNLSSRNESAKIALQNLCSDMPAPQLCKSLAPRFSASTATNNTLDFDGGPAELCIFDVLLPEAQTDYETPPISLQSDNSFRIASQLRLPRSKSTALPDTNPEASDRSGSLMHVNSTLFTLLTAVLLRHPSSCLRLDTSCSIVASSFFLNFVPTADNFCSCTTSLEIQLTIHSHTPP
mmetsp:Transcript_32281/g.70657  ORF Transcript_32281/g.70657 Transcript_32281/m.70657 type:complete len:282 (+) Transcript_32281:410-1255(+)